MRDMSYPFVPIFHDPQEVLSRVIAPLSAGLQSLQVTIGLGQQDSIAEYRRLLLLATKPALRASRVAMQQAAAQGDPHLAAHAAHGYDALLRCLARGYGYDVTGAPADAPTNHDLEAWCRTVLITASDVAYAVVRSEA